MTIPTRTARALAPVLFALANACAAADAIRVNAFPNAKALPLHAGIAHGIFAARGLEVQLTLTPSSEEQRKGLAAGKFEVAHAAVDNAVAMVDKAKQDVVIVTGGDNGMNQFFVQPTIGSFADLRGRIVIVDAPNTAYALLAKKILAKHGLKEGDYTVKPVGAGPFRLRAMAENKEYAAAILNLPFTVQAEEMGLKSLGNPVDLLGPYQAAGAFVRREWAKANAALLERYIGAYVEALRFSLNPAHRAESVAILGKELKLSAAVAERTYRQLANPATGFTPDARFDHEGFRNMLALRAEMEGGGAAAPEKYYDLSYYERAMARLAK